MDSTQIISNKSNGTYLIEKAILKLFKETNPSIDLNDKGVTMGSYLLKGQPFQLSAFSWRATSYPQKTEVDELCKLANNETVYVVVEEDYVQIHFLKDKDMEFSIQINTGGEEVATIWPQYLGVLIESEQVKEERQSFWESLFGESEDATVYDYFVTDDDAWLRKRSSL
jgi:hypothetical protein